MSGETPLGTGQPCRAPGMAQEPPSVGLCLFHLAKEGRQQLWGGVSVCIHTHAFLTPHNFFFFSFETLV